MEANKYYPVNEMVKMCRLKPKSDLFLRFVLYFLWLWVVNLENFTPSLSAQSSNLLPTFKLSLKANPSPTTTTTHTHTHTHTPTVWSTPTACTSQLSGVSYVASNNILTHTQMEHFFVDIKWSQIINNATCAGATRCIIIWNDITLDNFISLNANVKS